MCWFTSALETVSSNTRPHIGHCIAPGCFWGFLAAKENSASILDCLCFFAAGSLLLLSRFDADLLPVAVEQLVSELPTTSVSGLLLSCSQSDDVMTTVSSSSSKHPSLCVLSRSNSTGLAVSPLSSCFGLKKCLMVGGAVVAFCKCLPMTADTGSTWLLGLDDEYSAEDDDEYSTASSEASKSITDACMPFWPAAAACHPHIRPTL